MKYFVVIIASVFFLSCENKQIDAQSIIDKAILNAGGDIIASSTIHFKFRDYYYNATRNENERVLERCTDPECKLQRDVLGDEGFIRFRESIPTSLSDSLSVIYGNSVNSVHYFSVLPYGLNDDAVYKSLLDESTVKGEPYYRIKVTFSENGGGEDFQDEYLYWIHKDNFTVDYLAYNYQTNDGGTRFREAYNVRVIDGVRFVDYNNYKSEDKFPPLTNLDSLFENNKLKLLSKIELEEVSVSACPEC